MNYKAGSYNSSIADFESVGEGAAPSLAAILKIKKESKKE